MSPGLLRVESTARFAVINRVQAAAPAPAAEEPEAVRDVNPMAFLSGAFAASLFGLGPGAGEEDADGGADGAGGGEAGAGADASTLLWEAARGKAAALEALGSESYWASILGEGASAVPSPSPSPGRGAAQRAGACRAAYERAGFFACEAGEEDGAREDAVAAASAVRRVLEAGWPPVFALVCGAAWRVVGRAAALAEATGLLGAEGALLEPSAFIWALNTAGRRPGQRSFGLPHRDYAYDEAHDAATGEANVVNLWVALSDANLDAGCLWVVPRPLDPVYDKPADFRHLRSATRCGEEGSEQAFTRVRFDVGAARPCPVGPGGVVGWCNVIHYGGRCAPWAREPRVSLAFTLRRRGSPATHLNDGALAGLLDDWRRGERPLALGDRLRFIARALLTYEDWYDLGWEHFPEAARERWRAAQQRSGGG